MQSRVEVVEEVLETTKSSADRRNVHTQEEQEQFSLADDEKRRGVFTQSRIQQD